MAHETGGFDSSNMDEPKCLFGGWCVNYVENLAPNPLESRSHSDKAELNLENKITFPRLVLKQLAEVLRKMNSAKKCQLDFRRTSNDG